MTYPTSIPFEPEAVLRQILNWRVKGFLSLRSPVVVVDEFGNETACWDANICEDSKELTAEPSIMDKVRTVKDLIEILETKPKCLMVWTSPPLPKRASWLPPTKCELRLANFLLKVITHEQIDKI